MKQAPKGSRPRPDIQRKIPFVFHVVSGCKHAQDQRENVSRPDIQRKIPFVFHVVSGCKQAQDQRGNVSKPVANMTLPLNNVFILS